MARDSTAITARFCPSNRVTALAIDTGASGITSHSYPDFYAPIGSMTGRLGERISGSAGAKLWTDAYGLEALRHLPR